MQGSSGVRGSNEDDGGPDGRDVDWAIAASLRLWAKRMPDAVAITCEGVSRTWSELDDRSSRIAHGLVDAGVRPQERIVYLGANRTEFFEIAAGASKAGIVFLALSTRFFATDVAFILNDSRAAVLFVECQHLNLIGAVLEDLPLLRRVIVVDDGPRSELDAWIASHPPVDPHVAALPGDTAVMTYSPAATGPPLGAMFDDRSMREAMRLNEVVGLDSSSVVLVLAPVPHAAGASFGILALHVGASIVIVREMAARPVLDAIARHRVTFLAAVPWIVERLVTEPARPDLDVTGVGTIAYLAGRLAPELLRAGSERFGCQFLRLHGTIESGVATVLEPSEHWDAERPELLASAGRPLRYAAMRIVDPASGTELPDGETGEVWLRTPSRMSGYLGAPEATAAALSDDGFVRTGDTGHVSGGYLYLTDASLT